jgi:hypothetical protein
MPSDRKQKTLFGAMMPVNKHLRKDRQLHAFEKTSNFEPTQTFVIL